MKALLNFLFGLRGAFLAAGRDLMGNKAARTVMIGGVIFYSLLYPLPFHNEVPQKLPLFVVDQARSDLSRQLMRMIDSTEGVRVAAVTDSPQLALERMKGGDATAVLIIPGDFSRNIMRSGKTILPLYCDANYLLSYRVAFTGVRLAAENLGAGVRVERYQKAGMPQLSALSLQVRGQASVFTLYNPAGNYFLNTVPAVFVVILQQIMIIGCAMMSGKAWSSPTPGEHGRDACATTGRILLCCCLFFLHAFYYFWLLPIFYDVPRPLRAASAFPFPPVLGGRLTGLLFRTPAQNAGNGLCGHSPLRPAHALSFRSRVASGGHARSGALRGAVHAHHSRHRRLSPDHGARRRLRGNHAVVASALGAGPGLLRPGDLSGAAEKA